jgi:hypothetical protein
MQFGFKNAVSTHQPIFLLKELINKYIKEKSPLYVASLDAEKAYDSVWRDGIFFNIKDSINKQFWLVMKDYYDKAGVFKINNNIDNENIVKILRGVKQGGVLSPQLFNFYVDELIRMVQETGEGCRIEDLILAILAYSDNMLLAAPSITQMNKMIGKCEEFGKKWLIKFNAKKSVILNGGEKLFKSEQIKVLMGKSQMPVVEISKYLGINIDTIHSDDEQTLKRFKKVQSCFYGLGSYGLKPPGLKPKIKSFIYNTYCQPMGTYAFGLMTINKQTIQKLNIMQNNLIRYTLGIPYKTHIKLLLKCLNIIDVETVYLINKCTSIKLLHRDVSTKSILTKNINENNENWWFFKEIKQICELVNVSPKYLCDYPDKVREKILEKYFYDLTEDELEKCIQIEKRLINYSFIDKKELVNLIKLQY